MRRSSTPYWPCAVGALIIGAVLILAACSAATPTPVPTATPIPGFATMEEAHAACEAALGPLYRDAADATAEQRAAGRAVCQEARETSAALLAEAENAERSLCSPAVLQHADNTDDFRTCLAASQTHLDIIVAREDHLDRLYPEGVTGSELRRDFIEAAQDALDASTRWADAKDAGDAKAAINADVAVSAALERRQLAYYAMLESPVGIAQEDWSAP